MDGGGSGVRVLEGLVTYVLHAKGLYKIAD